MINDDGTEAFVPGFNQEFFTWDVYSTVGFSDRRTPGVNWCWDHISFGFYCPNHTTFIIQPCCCRIIQKNSTNRKPFSRTELNKERTDEERTASVQVVSDLEQKIDRQFRSWYPNECRT